MTLVSFIAKKQTLNPSNGDLEQHVTNFNNRFF